MESQFEVIKANFIRCEECNENFYFDFLRHPRYFVAHFKTCHLKNLLYRFNGHSEEENQKIRFGPRRKKDANAWFSQLKSTEKRMISMQDNKWSEIAEKECWSCRLCNDGKADLTHVFETTPLGRSHAHTHLRQMHEHVYEAILREISASQDRALPYPELSHHLSSSSTQMPQLLVPPPPLPPPPAPLPSLKNLTSSSTNGGRTNQQRMVEAERSRLRRMRATPEERQLEAQRSKRRRESLTPVQKQADYERRRKKKKRLEESERSKKRREGASEEMKMREVLRSRERRRNATEEQRKREAMRSKKRRENATKEQKEKERERCRTRYQLKKTKKKEGDGTGTGSDSPHTCGSPSGSASSSCLSSRRSLPTTARDAQLQQQERRALSSASLHQWSQQYQPPPPPPPNPHPQYQPLAQSLHPRPLRPQRSHPSQSQPQPPRLPHVHRQLTPLQQQHQQALAVQPPPPPRYPINTFGSQLMSVEPSLSASGTRSSRPTTNSPSAYHHPPRPLLPPPSFLQSHLSAEPQFDFRPISAQIRSSIGTGSGGIRSLNNNTGPTRNYGGDPSNNGSGGTGGGVAFV